MGSLLLNFLASLYPSHARSNILCSHSQMILTMGAMMYCLWILFVSRFVFCLPGSGFNENAGMSIIEEPNMICTVIPDAINTADDLLAKKKPNPGVCPSDFSHLLKRQSSSTTVDDYSCGPSKPCSNGACCAKTGYCGYGPDSCGNGKTPNAKCYSNCDATAECGRYAPKPGMKCPLNVCCSQFG